METKHFKYLEDIVKWVNTNISLNQIISITSAGKYSEGYILFYKTKQ